MKQLYELLKELETRHSILFKKLEKKYSEKWINEGVQIENRMLILKSAISILEHKKKLPVYISEPFKRYFPELIKFVK